MLRQPFNSIENISESKARFVFFFRTEIKFGACSRALRARREESLDPSPWKPEVLPSSCRDLEGFR
jgi:hypothetical protein